MQTYENYKITWTADGEHLCKYAPSERIANEFAEMLKNLKSSMTKHYAISDVIVQKITS